MSGPVRTDPVPHPTADAPTGPTRPARRWAFLITPGWLAAIALAVAFAAACFTILAPWQFSRNAERSAQNSAVAAAISAPPTSVVDYFTVTSPPDPTTIWHRATATGTFEPDAQVLVRLRQDDNGNPVSEVVVPFLMTDGTRVLVDRGTIPASGAAAPLPDLPTGTVTVTGRVQALDGRDPLNRPAQVRDGRTEVYAIMPSALPGVGPDEVFLDGYLQLVPNSPGVLTPIGLPQTDPGPFLSYALQWLAFGAMALLGIGFFVVREATGGGRDPDDRDFDDRDAVDPMGSAGAAGEVGEVVAGTAAGGGPSATRRRRRPARDGFDKSQLYDS